MEPREFLDLADDQGVAADEVSAALEITQLLEAVGTTPTILDRVTDAIRVYERDVLGQVTWQP